MDFNGITGLAGFGLIVGLWNNIKSWAFKIKSIFIVTIQIQDDREFAQAMTYYIVNNFKKAIWGNDVFRCVTQYVRTIKRNQIIAFIDMPKESTFYYEKSNKFKFIFVEKQESSHMTISLFRLFYNSKKFIQNALDEYNKIQQGQSENWRQYNRFYIKKITGTVGQRGQDAGRLSRTSDSPVAPCEDGSRHNFNKKIHSLIKWNSDEIGPQQVDSPISKLSLSKEHLVAVEEAIKWRNSEMWFKEKLVPWKRGWLLHGKPGCVLSDTKIKIRKIKEGKHSIIEE